MQWGEGMVIKDKFGDSKIEILSWEWGILSDFKLWRHNSGGKSYSLLFVIPEF